jgi:hypothetical protein
MEIVDMQHLAIFDDMAREIAAICYNYNVKANGVRDKAELLKIRGEQNDVLMETLRKHRRTMDFMAGKAVEPQTHFGEAVLIGVGGTG